jgi:membrane fusion protein (multidrug efflux system)
LDRVSVDTPANVSVESFSGKGFDGKVARIARVADPRTGEVDAFIAIDNTGGVVRPGLSCQVDLRLPEIQNALAVPRESIADRDGTPVVTLVRDGKAYETGVKLGALTPQYAQILEGLAAGDIVVTRGGYGLPDGCPVRIQPKE